MTNLRCSPRLILLWAACLTAALGCARGPAEAPDWKRNPEAVSAATDGSETANGERAEENRPLRWHDLTAQARNARQAGDYEKAVSLLDRATLLVRGLPPEHVRRRTVFASSVRLTEEMLRRGDPEVAAGIARELLAEASQAPALAGPSLSSLALSFVGAAEGSPVHAAREALGEDPWDDAELLGLALRITRAQPASRDRLVPARTILLAARAKGLLALAREAADLLLADTRHSGAADLVARAEILTARARLALELGDREAGLADVERAKALLGDGVPERNVIRRVEAIRAEFRVLEALSQERTEPGPD